MHPLLFLIFQDINVFPVRSPRRETKNKIPNFSEQVDKANLTEWEAWVGALEVWGDL